MPIHPSYISERSRLIISRMNNPVDPSKVEMCTPEEIAALRKQSRLQYGHEIFPDQNGARVSFMENYFRRHVDGKGGNGK